MAEWGVPGYTELKPLGSGGFGDVALARHDASGGLVAIKYLRRSLLADAELAWRFRREAEVLASLDDPNVVRLYEYVESPSGAAIVMELIDGISLREILAHQGATTPEAALVVLQGSLLGLAAAHRHGVVHRDYKPENVLINANGVSKLTDFGIAARAGDRPPPSGTVVYAPPEQFAGVPASPAGDVYSATATFYECLVGRPPFSGDTAEALLYQHLSQPVPLDPVPEPLRPLVIAGMAKEPQDRPADGTSFITALNSIASGAYGPDWEERGRSHLGEAALLLALLWPTGGSPAAQGFSAQPINMSQAAPAHEFRHPRRRPIGLVRAAIVAAAAIVVVAGGTALASALSRPAVSQGPQTVRFVSPRPLLAPPSGTGSGSASPSPPGSASPSPPGSSSPSPPGSSSPSSSGPSSPGSSSSSSSDSSSSLGSGSGSSSSPGSGLSSGSSSSPPPAHPAVTAVSPSSGTTRGGTVVTITGTGLAGATGVSFGGAAGTITADSGTQVTVASPPGTGTASITVTTPAGTSAVTHAGQFSYIAPAPAVTGVSPASGPSGGGTVVTITGTGLAGATGVSFGGAAGTITADSGTQITVTSPPGTGTASITVTTPAGTSAVTHAAQFSYLST